MSAGRSLCKCVAVGVTFVLVSLSLTADGPLKTLSPYFLIEKGEGEAGDEAVSLTERFPLKKTAAKVSICGVIADVTVTQQYENTGTDPINAQYVFPSSTRAAVHGMKMRVGDYVIKAQIKERKEAKKAFIKAKKAGKSASLLEQQRPNVFTMNVANIMPGDVVEIELKYTEMLVPTDGVYEFVYPTVVGPRYTNIPTILTRDSDDFVNTPYTEEEIEPKYEFSLEVAVKTGVPFQRLTCDSHEVEISRKTDRIAELVLSDIEKNGANRDFILRYCLKGKQIQSGVIFYEGEKENYFVVMSQPPDRIEAITIPPREYIFVVDVSGSMNGFPLDTSKELLKNLIGSLRDTDRFNVILFAGCARMLAEESLTANKENITRALSVIDNQTGGGGTELSAALKKAMKLPKTEGVSRSVLVITDGYISFEKEAFDLIQNNLNRTNVFAFGIGSGVNRYLIEGIARTGMGEPFVVTKPVNASTVAEKFRKYVESPVMTDISVKFEDVDVYDLEPKQIPDMFAERPIIIMGKWRGELAGTVYVKGTMTDGAYEEEIPLNTISDSDSNQGLRYLWARTRIARLSDYNANADPETRKKIVSLGLTYNLLTQYTSFIAILEKIRNPDGSAKDVKQPLPLPKGVSNLAVGRRVPEPGLWILIALIGCAFGVMIVKRKIRCELVTKQ